MESTNRFIKRKKSAAGKRKKFHNKILGLVFLAVLVICNAINLLVPDRTYSDEENRNLASFPAFSMTALADGSYFDGLEDYMADQFFARDAWISLKMTEDKMLGRKESGGVFMGKDGYLLGQPDQPAEGLLDRTITSVKAFSDKYSNISMHMMIIPGAALVTPEYLPAYAQVYDQQKDLDYLYEEVGEQVDCIDAAEALDAHDGEYIYYKTDHHWTSLGASYGFEAAKESLGISGEQEYAVYPVATDFQGTLSSKSGSHSAKDRVDIYVNTSDPVQYYVDYPDTGTQVTSIYNSAALETKDKYTVFFGGNHPILTITTTANNGKNLLIFKDSYANSFVQFLLPYYQKIIMVDPRYYYDNINTVINGEAVTDILYLYSADTFLTDSGLADVLDSAVNEENEVYIPEEETGEL